MCTLKVDFAPKKTLIKVLKVTCSVIVKDKTTPRMKTIFKNYPHSCHGKISWSTILVGWIPFVGRFAVKNKPNDT